MSKRIHELAKEWGVAPKDMMAALERIGVRGKRSQSSLSDDEVQRAREALGLVSRPAVSLGTERVVQQQARLAAQRRHGIDTQRTAPEPVEVDSAAVARPCDGDNVSVLAIVGEDGPTAAVGLHHGELR